MKIYRMFFSMIILGVASSTAQALKVKYEGEEGGIPIEYTLCLDKRPNSGETPLSWGKFCNFPKTPLQPQEERVATWGQERFIEQFKRLQGTIQRPEAEQIFLSATIWDNREGLIELATCLGSSLSKDASDEVIASLYNGTLVYHAQDKSCRFMP